MVQEFFYIKTVVGRTFPFPRLYLYIEQNKFGKNKGGAKM